MDVLIGAVIGILSPIAVLLVRLALLRVPALRSRQRPASAVALTVAQPPAAPPPATASGPAAWIRATLGALPLGTPDAGQARRPFVYTCPVCNYRISPTARFCRSCGALIRPKAEV